MSYLSYEQTYRSVQGIAILIYRMCSIDYMPCVKLHYTFGEKLKYEIPLILIIHWTSHHGTISSE